MTATRSKPWRGNRIVCGVIAVMLALSALSSARSATSPVRARPAPLVSQAGEFLLAPLADLVTPATWLAIAGEDPRRAILPASARQRQELAAPAAATPAPDEIDGDFSGEQLISRATGPVAVSVSPALVVDPRDPRHLVLAATDLDLPSPAIYSSADGGATWDGPRQVPYLPGDRGTTGNASVAFGRDGALYLASLSVGADRFTLGNAGFETPTIQVAVSRSDDGGGSWQDPSSTARAAVQTMTMVDEAGRTRGEIRAGAIDSPALTAGVDPANPGNDILYLTYTEFTLRYPILYADEIPILGAPVIESTIRLARSTDRGETWSAPIAISPVAAIAAAEGGSPSSAPPADERPPSSVPRITPAAEAGAEEPREQVVQGPALAVLDDGTLCLAYFDSTGDGVQRGLARVMVATSRDGGRTFSEPAQAGIFREIPLTPRTLPIRWWSSGFPRLAVGANDALFIVVTARAAAHPTDDGDLLLLRSLDRGQQWEEPVVIDAGATSSLQFFPAIAATANGALHAVWGDTRDDPSGVRYDILYAESTDNGASWAVTDPRKSVAAPDRRISSQPSNALFAYAGGRFLGDRFALAPAGDDLAIAWVALPDTGPREAIALSRKLGEAAGSPTPGNGTPTAWGTPGSGA
ncbi:MAG: exo-alpha-sialidase [Thermomicrobiales bacterium]|nr:exo-alpha-sialidase [Thermomicrobiales bacterium]